MGCEKKVYIPFSRSGCKIHYTLDGGLKVKTRPSLLVILPVVWIVNKINPSTFPPFSFIWFRKLIQICEEKRLWAAGRGQQQDQKGKVKKRPSNGVSESRQHPVSYLAGVPHNFIYYQRALNHRESQRMALCINFISQDNPAWLSIGFQHDPDFYLIFQLDARGRERLSDLPIRPWRGCFL